MNYILDMHTHSLASGHSYSTIREMAHMASQKGMLALGITEHGPNMPGSCHHFYFSNLKVVPRQMCGVELFLGIELNLLDSAGHVDLDDKLLQQMDVTIASLHIPCCKPASKKENTDAYLNALKNPYINIIGHPDDNRYAIDYDALIYTAKEYNKLIEFNNASLNPRGARVGAKENDYKILELCKKYQQPVILGSDAHVDADILNFQLAQSLLEEVDFPQELVINHSLDKLKKYVNKYRYIT